jgi:hypothetical protein
MFSLFLSLLILLVVALKVMALGSLVLACLILYAFWRLMSYWLGFCRSTGSGCQKGFTPVYYKEPHRAEPVCHRMERPRYAPPPPPPRPVRPVSPRPTRSSSPSWLLWGAALLVVGLVAYGLRNHDRPRGSFFGITREAKANKTKAPSSARKADKAERTPSSTEVRDVARGETSWSVKGVAASEKDAVQAAFAKARQGLLDYLQAQVPPIDWPPPDDFVEKHLKISDREVIKEEVDDDQTIYQAKFSVEVTPENRQEILQSAHHYRIEQRLMDIGKIFAVLIALLAGVAGYIRLDEWSKGHFPAWLRLAALGLLAAAGVGVWWFLRDARH